MPPLMAGVNCIAMNKLDLIILKERFKFFSKSLLPIAVVLLLVLSSLIMKTPIGEPIIRECDVVSKGSNFSYDGNNPFVTCELNTKEVAMVFSIKASNLYIGQKIKVRERRLLFWYTNSYTYIDE